MAFLLLAIPAIAAGLASLGVEVAAGAAVATGATALATAALATGSTALASATISSLAATGAVLGTTIVGSTTVGSALIGLTAGAVGAAVGAGTGLAISEVLAPEGDEGPAPIAPDHPGNPAEQPIVAGKPVPAQIVAGGSAPPVEVNPGSVLSASNALSHMMNFDEQGGITGGPKNHAGGGLAGKISPIDLQIASAAAFGINGPSTRSILSKELRAKAILLESASLSSQAVFDQYVSGRVVTKPRRRG